MAGPSLTLPAWRPPRPAARQQPASVRLAAPAAARLGRALGATAAGASFGDLYLRVLLLAVAAYAIFGKGFAYAGVPPLFPAEMILAAGLLTLLVPRISPAVLSNGPAAVFALLLGWTLIRTLPYVPVHGIDALRDSVVAVYGLFALVVANLILGDPRRLTTVATWAARFYGLYVFIALPAYMVELAAGDALPHWPASPEATLIALRSGEIAVHLTAATALALAGLKRSSVWWLGALLVSIAVLAALSRGAMVAIAIPALLVIVMTGRIVPLLALAVVGLTGIGFLYVTGISIEIPGVARSLDVRQILANIASIFGTSEQGSLQDNKAWRLEWWSIIVGYTFGGDHFWTGRGFGPNLALMDGFVGAEADGPLLRSPHNIFMTFLARGGVPGLALWVLFLLAWFAMVVRQFYRARAARDPRYAAVFIVVFATALSAIVNASFDVALEGPMAAIVFWVAIGTGIGASMRYDAATRPARRHRRRAALAASSLTLSARHGAARLSDPDA